VNDTPVKKPRSLDSVPLPGKKPRSLDSVSLPKRRPILKRRTTIVKLAMEVPALPDRNGTKAPPEAGKRYMGWLRRLHIVRQQAAVDYITDPDGHSAEWHHERTDREYMKIVTIHAFNAWREEDRWVERREQFWREVEARVLAQWREKMIQRKLAEIDELTEIREYYSEYMKPLRNKDGTVKRGEDGLPEYGLKMPSMDRWIRAFLEVDERLMTKRGEATVRTETQTPEMQARIAALDPVTATARLTPEDLRAMSREILRRRQPDLLDPELVEAVDGES